LYVYTCLYVYDCLNVYNYQNNTKHSINALTYDR